MTTPAGASYVQFSIIRTGVTPTPATTDSLLLDDLSFELLGVPKEEPADFTDFADVPGSYIGGGLKSVRVNSTQAALEFVQLQHLCKAWVATASVSIPGGTSTAVPFTDKLDPDSTFDLSNETWTSPSDGFYEVEWNFAIVPDSSHWLSGGVFLSVIKNYLVAGGSSLVDDTLQERSGGLYVFSGRATFELSQNDTINFFIKETTAKTTTINGQSAGHIEPGKGAMVTITTARTE